MIKSRSMAVAGAASLALLALLAVRVNDRPVDDPIEILRRVSATYRSLPGGRFTGSRIVNVPGASPENADPRDFEIAFLRTGAFRRSTTGLRMPQVLVSDGTSEWLYLPSYRQYTQGASSDPYADSELRHYERLGEDARAARLVPGAVLDSDPSVPCFVMDVEYEIDPPAGARRLSSRLWIDRRSWFVLREVSQVASRDVTTREEAIVQQTITWTSVEPGTQLDPDTFTFTPASSDLLVDEFRDPSHPDLTGEPARDFALRGLDGRTFTLTDHRQQVVVLAFWASWCQPCQLEMPVLQRLHDDFQSHGLVIVGLSGEREAEARAYLAAQGYTFPSLVDAERAVHRLYDVPGIPTSVVIGRDGVIAAHFIGYRGEGEWRAELAKLGLP